MVIYMGITRKQLYFMRYREPVYEDFDFVETAHVSSSHTAPLRYKETLRKEGLHDGAKPCPVIGVAVPGPICWNLPQIKSFRNASDRSTRGTKKETMMNLA